MTRSSFMIIFSIIAGALIMTALLRGYISRNAYREIDALEEAVDFATYSALYTLSDSYGEDGVLEKTSAEFFRAFEIHAGTPEQDLWLYVPAFIYLDVDGFYVGGYEQTSRKYAWSDVQPYILTVSGSNRSIDISFTLNDEVTFTLDDESATVGMRDYFDGHYDTAGASAASVLLSNAGYALFTEDNYERLKQSAIAVSVSRAVEQLINQHNRMTAKIGISYSYATPTFVDIGTDLPSFLVCFQGYPIRSNGTYYSNLVNRAAYIKGVH